MKTTTLSVHAVETLRGLYELLHKHHSERMKSHNTVKQKVDRLWGWTDMGLYQVTKPPATTVSSL